jgi:hypothetical protein
MLSSSSLGSALYQTMRPGVERLPGHFALACLQCIGFAAPQRRTKNSWPLLPGGNNPCAIIGLECPIEIQGVAVMGG